MGSGACAARGLDGNRVFGGTELEQCREGMGSGGMAWRRPGMLYLCQRCSPIFAGKNPPCPAATKEAEGFSPEVSTGCDIAESRFAVDSLCLHFRVTGQPFGTDYSKWIAWWEKDFRQHPDRAHDSVLP